MSDQYQNFKFACLKETFITDFKITMSKRQF